MHCSISIDSIGCKQIRLSTGSGILIWLLCIICDINNLLIYNNYALQLSELHVLILDTVTLSPIQFYNFNWHCNNSSYFYFKREQYEQEEER